MTDTLTVPTEDGVETKTVELYVDHFRHHINGDRWYEPPRYFEATTDKPLREGGDPMVVELPIARAEELVKAGAAGEPGTFAKAREAAAGQAAANLGVDLGSALSEKDAEIAELKAQLEAAKAAQSSGKGSSGSSSGA